MTPKDRLPEFSRSRTAATKMAGFPIRKPAAEPHKSMVGDTGFEYLTLSSISGLSSRTA